MQRGSSASGLLTGRATLVADRTLLRCLACHQCWEWRGWLKCKRCQAPGAASTSKPAVTWAAGGSPGAGAGLLEPSAPRLHARTGAPVGGGAHTTQPTIASLWELATKYSQMTEHGHSVADYDAYCNHALKHGVVRYKLRRPRPVACTCLTGCANLRVDLHDSRLMWLLPAWCIACEPTTTLIRLPHTTRTLTPTCACTEAAVPPGAFGSFGS